MATSDLPPSELSQETQELLAEEGRLEELARDMDARLSGMKDIDLSLALAKVKLRLCIVLLKKTRRAGEGFEDVGAAIGRRALSAIRLVDGLVSQNISEDQRGTVQDSPLFSEVKRLLEEFLVSGGGGLLEPLEMDERKRRILSRTVVTSIRKYLGEDDLYPPFDVQRYPAFVQQILLSLFPVMIRLRPQKPPYGIEEGEEMTYSSRAMRVPLSQAIHYMENELLPQLERRLASQPGDAAIQEQARRVREQLEEYRKLRVYPRAAPVLPLEKGYHTQGMMGFTPDGEILVSLPLPVTFKSGTNLDRKMELVRMDVVRRIAGKRVSREIDREYRRLRSIESGPRGSSRTPSLKLDPGWGFWVLRQDFPFLTRLSDKKLFQELAGMVRSGSLGAAQRRVSDLIAGDQGRKAERPSIR